LVRRVAAGVTTRLAIAALAVHGWLIVLTVGATDASRIVFQGVATERFARIHTEVFVCRVAAGVTARLTIAALAVHGWLIILTFGAADASGVVFQAVAA
jgi:hypothetical protein